MNLLFPAYRGLAVEEAPSPLLCVRLAHACPIVRAGLAAILGREADLVVVDDIARPPGCGDTGIVLTDYASAMAALRWPGAVAPLMIVTARSKEGEVRRAVDAGVRGYLLQGCPVDELLKGVRLLGAGNSYLCATALRSLTASFRPAALTRREIDVLRVLAQGRTDKLIARELGIGLGTVKHHLKGLMTKLDASTRTHVVVLAMERGLLQHPGDSAPALPAAGAGAGAGAGAAARAAAARPTVDATERLREAARRFAPSHGAHHGVVA